MSPEFKFPFHLPGSREVDSATPTPRNFGDLLDRITHTPEVGGPVVVNPKAEEIADVMTHAEEHDLDVVLTPTGTGTVVTVGKWIADHKRILEVGAAAALIGTVAIGGILGVALRKHNRETPPQDK